MNQNQGNIDDHLLLQYLLGNAGAEAQKDIDEWLNESKENRACLDRLESLWLETAKLDPAPVAVDIEKAWKMMSQRIDQVGEEISVQKRGKIITVKWLKLALGAAAITLLFVGIYSLYMTVKKPVQEIVLISADKVLVDTLPDGSSISLNKNSKLVYPEQFKGKTREVKLTGEAFFDIRHDSAKSFIIEAGIAKVKVLGTAFRISAYPDSAVEVNVTRGRVMFFTINPRTGDTSRVILPAGAKGLLTLKSVIPIVVENIAPDDLFWFDHTLEFNRTPLSRVFRLLEKYYPVTIQVSNENIHNCLLTASFADDPIDRILTVIAESFDLKVISKNQTYLLTGNGCNEMGK
jgi:transmembrane sensor